MDALQPAHGGGRFSGFVTRLSADGTALRYSTYLSGAQLCGFSGCDTGDASDIAVDSLGFAYVTGNATPGLPGATSGAFPSPNPSSWGPFIVKLDTAQRGAASLIFATYVSAGGFSDRADAIAVDPSFNTYITGQTSGPFPTTPDSVTPVPMGNGDAFVAKVNPSGTSLVHGTYLGGNGTDFGRGIAVDAEGNLYVADQTDSRDFPAIGAYQPAYGGGLRDAFVAVIGRPTFC